jgi:hypothetical protein
MKNFFLNKTTAERFGHNAQKSDNRISMQVNTMPFFFLNTKKLIFQNSSDYDKSLLEISSKDFRNSNARKSSSGATKNNNRCRYLKNCYAMCFGNENNLKAEQSWLLRS